MSAPQREEAERLARLRDLLVLDSAAEPLFDNLVRTAAEFCGVPISLISLIDERRQWFKAQVGVSNVRETPREHAFCAHAILDDAIFEIADATRDERFMANPLVTGAPHIRFYAGAPLILPSGERIGTLCVMDRAARRLSSDQAGLLRHLASIAADALVMRGDLLQRSLSARSSYEQTLAISEARHRTIVEEQTELISLCHPDGRLVYVNPAYAEQFGHSPAELKGRKLLDLVASADREMVQDRIDRVLSTGEQIVGENRMAGKDGGEIWVGWTNSLQTQADGGKLLRSVGRDLTAHKRAEAALHSSQAFMKRTGRVAGVGGWELLLATGTLTWSDETRRIHEVPESFQPTLENAVAFYAPHVRAKVEAAVEHSMTTGEGWDLELPLVTATGRSIWVRAVGEVEFEGDQVVRLVGAFQDITTRRKLEQQVTDSERFIRQITDNLSVRIAYVDHERAYRFVNEAQCRRFSLPREQVLGRSYQQLVGNNEQLALKIAAVLAGASQQFEFDETIDGRTLRIESRLTPDTAEDGSVRGYFASGIDITERSHAERESRRQTAILRSVTDVLPAIVYAVDRDLNYRFVNNAFEKWHGVARDQVLGKSIHSLLPRQEIETSMPGLNRALAGETVQLEHNYPRRAGQPTMALSYIPVIFDDGSIDSIVGVALDITPHRQEQVRLKKLAERDPLTGLLNRAGFENRLHQQLQSGERDEQALLYIDLDHFKAVNDNHGHLVGDKLLQKFANRLTRMVRPTDAIARLGGDEFAVLLGGVKEIDVAQNVAAKVLDATRQPFDLDGLVLQIGASIGVARGSGADDKGRDLLARADAHLYRAKQSGRGRQSGDASAKPSAAKPDQATRE